MRNGQCLKLGFVFLVLLICLPGCEQATPIDKELKQTDVKEYKIGPARFLQAHELIRTRVGKTQPDYQTGDVVKEYNKALNRTTKSAASNLGWIERGPGNVGGRTRGLVVDPSDPTAQTWFAASVGGGIWHTDDAGQNWKLLTNNLTSLSTSTIAMSPANPEVLYVGTGEGFGNIDGIIGTGMWKSLDKGKTWEVLENTIQDDFSYVTRIIVNPDDENELYASTINSRIQGRRTFIFKSVDGGETWSSVYTNSGTRIQQLVASPDDFNVIYGTVNSRSVIRTNDGGENWEEVWQVQDDERRIEMAISPNDAGIIYLSCELDEGSRLYSTSDTFRTVTPSIFKGVQPNWLANQGWYDNTIAVHPYNSNKVWVAGQSSIMELTASDSIGLVKELDEYRNETTFIEGIEDGPFTEEAGGLAIDLFQGLPVNVEFDESDLIDVVIRMGFGQNSMAHLIDVDIANFEFSYNSMIEVPFQAWDITNNRQIGLSVADVNGDGEWTFEEFTSGEPLHDVVMTNNFDYTEGPNPRIETDNPFYKAQYYYFMSRSEDYTGPKDDLPIGTIIFETIEREGRISEFVPITDGYYTYDDVAPVGPKGVHVDHHNIIMIPRDSVSESFYVLNANDGGVAFSDDNGDSFFQTGDAFNDGTIETSKGYNTSQFYGVDKKNGENRFVAGSQDNGSWVSPADPDSSSTWVDAPSGDGFEAAWHYRNTDLILETSQFNRLYKSYDEGLSWDRVDLPDSDGPFITRLASSQLNPDLVFMVSDKGVLRSDDFAENWEIISMPNAWVFGSSWGSPITISLADPAVVWTGSGITASSRVAYSTDGGLSFDVSSNYSGAELGTVTGITTHPHDPETAYVLFSQKDGPKILKTTDLGQNWEDISGFVVDNNPQSINGFPNVAVYSLLVMPWNGNMIWAGTEIGIFESLDGGETWAYADNGLPPLSVWQMKIVNDEIVIASHGRGIWTLNTAVFEGVSVKDVAQALEGELNLLSNPMSESSVIEFNLIKRQKIDLAIYDLEGKKIFTIYTGQAEIGTTSLGLERGNLVPGTYLVNLKGENGQISKKLVVI